MIVWAGFDVTALGEEYGAVDGIADFAARFATFSLALMVLRALIRLFQNLYID